MNRKLETLPQLLGELCYLPRLRALFPAHPEGVPEHDFANLVLADRALQPAEIGALVLPFQRLQSLGGNAQRIGNRQAHAPAAVIDGQDACGNFHLRDYTKRCILTYGEWLRIPSARRQKSSSGRRKRRTGKKTPNKCAARKSASWAGLCGPALSRR